MLLLCEDWRTSSVRYGCGGCCGCVWEEEEEEESLEVFVSCSRKTSSTIGMAETMLGIIDVVINVCVRIVTTRRENC